MTRPPSPSCSPMTQLSPMRCGSRCTCQGSGPCRSARGFSCCGLPFSEGPFEPVDLCKLADDHIFVAVRSDGAVIVEPVGPLDIAAVHVGGFQQIGRASGRYRVCQYFWISVVAVSLQKKKN